MKKSKLALVAINLIFLVTVPVLGLTESNQVAAATVKGYVKTRSNKKVRLYTIKGKHSNC